MISLQKKITQTYWIKKLGKQPLLKGEVWEISNSNSLLLQPEQLAYFRKITASNEIAEFTVLLSIYGVLLRRYFSNLDFIYSERKNEGNNWTSLLLKIEELSSKRIREYIQATKEEVLEAHKHMDVSWTEELENIPNQYTRFTMSYDDPRAEFNNDFPFQFVVMKTPENGLSFRIDYAENFVSNQIVSQFLKVFQVSVLGLSDNISLMASRLNIVDAIDRKMLLEDFGRSNFVPTSLLNVVQLFEGQVKALPNTTAILHNKNLFSYGELNSESNKLARFLSSQYNIDSNDLVAIDLPRNEKLIISILAVLKLGAGYVPIDRNYPKKRTEYIKKNSKCKITVSDLIYKNFSSKKASYPAVNLNIKIPSDTTAYVIYTSGTTGKPKGVEIMHSNLSVLLNWARQAFDANSFKHMFASTSHCFDLSVFEMFYPFSVGKTVRILENAIEMENYITSDEAIFINTVPSAIRNMLDNKVDLSHVTNINLAGEKFPVEIANELADLPIHVKNLYGPSEDTTYSTYYKLGDSENSKSIPIGRPIAGTRLYVLDQNLQLLPAGVPGRLYVSGDGVAKGYLNAPALTKEKFTDDPFHVGNKMYDTGDLVKWMPDGNLEFIGRNDDQVKFRGWRIELSEIEHSILLHKTKIDQCVVMMSTKNGNSVLIAYFTSSLEISREALHTHLVNNLPKYMVPSYFKQLPEIPLSPNGKIDRNKLSEINWDSEIRTSYVPPKNELQEQLIAIWEEVLNVDQIGIEDRFIELGGHSLLVSQIINRINKQINKDVSFQIFFTNPTVAILSKKLKDYKALKSIQLAPRMNAYPVTSFQNRIFMLSQFDGGSAAYSISAALRIYGTIDRSNLENALDLLVERFEILRTVFKVDDEGQLLQHIKKAQDCKAVIEYHDLLKSKNPNQEIQDFSSFKFNSFALDSFPLFQITLFQTKDNEYVMHLFMHHIISDGWSLRIMQNQLFRYYSALEKKTSLPTLSPEIQFKDYAFWSVNEAANKALDTSLQYWLNNLSGELPILNIPNYQGRPKVKQYLGQAKVWTYPKDTLLKIEDFSKEHEITLFVFLMTCVNLILSRYSNQTDIIVGTAVAGRSKIELETQIGLFLNTLAIRTQINKQGSIIDLLAQVKKQVVDAYQHQDLPFDTLIEKLNITRDASRSPLFDVMVVLQNQNQLSQFHDKEETSKIEITEYDLRSEKSQFDLSFIFDRRQDDSLVLSLVYDSEIYDTSFIDAIYTHIDNLFHCFVDEPEQKICTVDFLGESEKQQLLDVFNDTKSEYDQSKTVIDLFTEKAKDFPDNLAIVMDDLSMTYAKLNEEVNKLANYLIVNQSIEQNDLVVLLLERNADYIISILAILKCGAAYVPVDPGYPNERIDYILENAKAKLLIDENFLIKFRSTSVFKTKNPNISVDSSALAYVIYTSGSTGRPKGVMIEHRSLVNLCHWHVNAFNVSATSRGALYASIAFDASVWEIFPYLISGASISPLQDDEDRLQVQRLVHYFDRYNISHAYLPTKICELVIQEKINIPKTVLLTGGESITYSEKIHLQLYNNYGPTENTVVATWFDCNDFEGNRIPIGKPIANVEVYILTSSLKLQPVGVIGYLYIAGDGLARGYLNNESLTKKSFVDNPFQQNEKMYKTGDLARWLPDGNLEFIGRKDAQIKIRGHRIELDEIIQVIEEFSEEIRRSIVISEVQPQGTILAGYFTSKKEIDINALLQFLRTKLPSYMVPTVLEHIDEIPLTANGKIDFSALPKINNPQLPKKKTTPPSTNFERSIVETWQELFSEKDVGMEDDFFELGGHSLLLTKLMNTYSKKFEVVLSLNDLYENTTIEQHARIIEKAPKTRFHKIKKVKPQSTYELSPSQMRFYLLNKLEGKTKKFNIYSTLTLGSDIDFEVLSESINDIVSRHESLRTVFLEEESVPKMSIIDIADISIDLKYFENLATAEDTIYNQEFDLEIFPLFHVGLVKVENATQLLFNVHHIITDGWSMNLISKEIHQIYHAKLNGLNPSIASIDIQYKDYAHWQKNILASNELLKQKSYWLNQLAGDLPYLKLPADYLTPDTKQKEASGYFTVYLNDQDRQQIRSLSSKHKVSVFSFFMATLKILLHRITGEKDLIIGIPVANRNHDQLKNIVGCFLNTLMIRDKIEVDNSCMTFLKAVTATLQQALINQNYPFEDLLENITVAKDLKRFPISSVFLNMLDFEATNETKIESFEAKNGTTIAPPKFDFECYVKSFSNGYAIDICFDRRLFKEETIKYWSNEYISIIKQILKDSKESIRSLNIFSENIDTAAYKPIVKEFNLFESKDIFQPISHRFEVQVKKTPDLIAVNCDGVSLTYSQLNEKANILAHNISTFSSESNKRITLLLDQDETCAIAMLAVLKAGNSYVPLDPNTPLKRILYILKDAASNVLIFSEKTKELAQEVSTNYPELATLDIASKTEESNSQNPEVSICCEDEAYILYTSGSTGVPKGVIQSQKNVLHYIRVYTNNTCIASNDNLSVFPSFTFDASVKDIYGAILNGATAKFFNIAKYGFEALKNWIMAEHITIVHFVPTIFRQFMKHLGTQRLPKAVRIVDLGGEASYIDDFIMFKKHFAEGAVLINDYGPTEATIVSQKFLTHTSELTRNSIPLGKAVTETEVFLVDAQGERVGIYEEGEIVFRSDYLSLGYLNKIDKTNEAFIKPTDSSHKRSYKSGDIGRLTPTGEIEFVARKDGQVKLNGLRIELPEIEHFLENIQEIEKAVVMIKPFAGQNILVGYIKKKGAISSDQIIIALSKWLPTYMIPLRYIEINEFPRTRTGKINRKQLPDLAENKKVAFSSPRNETEKLIVEILASSLNIDAEKIGIKDNFFELGANSMKMIKILNTINTALGTNFQLITLFQHPSIHSLMDNVYQVEEEEIIEPDISESIDDMMDLINE